MVPPLKSPFWTGGNPPPETLLQLADHARQIVQPALLEMSIEDDMVTEWDLMGFDGIYWVILPGFTMI